MERFYAGVIIRVSLMRVAPLHALCGLPVGLTDVLTASAAVDDERLGSRSVGFRFIEGIDYA